MGIDIAYYRTIAYMGRRLTLPGLSATRRAVAARRELPDSPAAPHFTGGEPAAPGERIPAEPARSVEGSERHRGRLEAHWLQNLHFLVWRQGGSQHQGGFHLCTLSRLALETGGSRGRKRCRPIAWMNRRSCPGWRRMISRTTGPSGASRARRPATRTSHVPRSTRRPLPRFSRAKLALAKDSIP